MRHRHRDAAREPCNHQQRLQRAIRQSQCVHRMRRRGGMLRIVRRGRRWATKEQRKGQHRRRAEDADAEVGGPPSRRRDEVLDDRRPQCSGQIIAAREDRYRDATASIEPQRRMREQRCERCGTAGPDQHALRKRIQRKATRETCRDVTERKGDRSDDDRHDDAEAIRQLAHQDARYAEAHHRQRVRQRCSAPGNAEFRLHCRQRYDDGPHADAADRGQHERDDQSDPCIAGFNLSVQRSRVAAEAGRHGDC